PFDGAAEGDAGIVEDEIAAAVLGDHGVRPGVDLLAIADVDAARADLRPERLDLRDGLRETDLVDVAERELGAPLRERDRQRATDARARASDGGDLVAEVFHRSLRPWLGEAVHLTMDVFHYARVTSLVNPASADARA